MSRKSSEKFNFEQSIDRLEKLVNTMEAGNLPLEDSLKYFEEGVQLIRQCQGALQTAEQKVQTLIEKEGTLQLEPFTVDNES